MMNKMLLLSTTYFIVNTKLCKELGFREGVYLSALIEEQEDALSTCNVIRVDNKEYFTISRARVLDRTSISRESQRKLQVKLFERGILETFRTGKSNYHHINYDAIERILLKLILEEDTKCLE